MVTSKRFKDEWSKLAAKDLADVFANESSVSYKPFSIVTSSSSSIPNSDLVLWDDLKDYLPKITKDNKEVKELKESFANVLITLAKLQVEMDEMKAKLNENSSSNS